MQQRVLIFSVCPIRPLDELATFEKQRTATQEGSELSHRPQPHWFSYSFIFGTLVLISASLVVIYTLCL